jgi:acetyl esterase
VTDSTNLARWLDAEIRSFVALTLSFYPKGDNPADIAVARERYNGMCAGLRAPRPPGVTVEDQTVPTSWGGVAVRCYRPSERLRATALLYAHGGGFVLGGLESHDDVCAELCERAGVDVVAVDYRLAPEHVYPAALDDVAAVHARLAATREVVVAGDSAGAALVATLCHRLRRLGIAQPRGQVLIYPGLSADPMRVSGSRAAEAPMLTAADCVEYGRLHAGGDVPRGDPEFAPLEATDVTGLAPAAIFAAGYDPLRQDAEDYAAILHAAGVTVRYRCDPALVHGWLRARHRAEVARRAFRAVVAAVEAFADGTAPD